jgi:hypothetical protein
MASWEQEITEELQAVQDVAVRFDIPQQLTTIQKSTAKGNISIGSSASIISDDDYKITLNY